MSVKVVPGTAPGWFSVALVVASVLLFVLFVVILGPGPDYNMPLAYALTGVIAIVSVAAVLTGLFGVIRRGERAILVYIATAVGAYSLLGCVTALLGLQR
jgi:hypothetical protein